jgi:hypothetical protein
LSRGGRPFKPPAPHGNTAPANQSGGTHPLAQQENRASWPLTMKKTKAKLNM